jgi:hypothetical protein
MGLKTFGLMGVDWEERVDFSRLRRERLARAGEALERSEAGSLLCFDMSNIRYVTATHIGTWAMDKLARFSLLPRGADPIVWDFGSAARHHELYCPWLEGRSPAGISTMRGAMSPASGRAEDVARKVRVALEEQGLHNDPVAVDVVELPVLFCASERGPGSDRRSADHADREGHQDH